MREGRGTVGQLLTDDALYQRAKTIAADAERAMANVREATDEARAAIADFRGEGGPVKGLTGDLQQTLAAARDAMSDLAEKTEALKRNFFFRGFFNRRGYFDLDDVTVEQYRQGALETKDRRVLRIWVGSPMLFERDANGRGTVERRWARAARLGDVAVRQIPANEPVRRRRVCARRDSRRAIPPEPAPGATGARLHRGQIRPRPGARRDDADGGSGGGKRLNPRHWDGVALAMFVPVGA